MVTDTYGSFLAGILINLLAAVIIARWIYYPRKRAQDYIFTFLAFSTVIYLVMGLFTSVELSIGVGFGLFALFSVLRYRTDTVPIREMTYLFVMVALPIMNSILYNGGDIMKLCLSDSVIIAVLFILEQKWGFRYEQKKLIKYEKIDLVRADEHDRLIEDLRERTGLVITQVDILEIDFIRDSADIVITYEEGPPVIPKKSQGSDTRPVEESRHLHLSPGKTE
ncbi:MAG TPA: DUF4956 domain-containing protein [Methanospirillum sp.]|uniref:DUF4956 domain-containing protein n=1 Tax=Methanospirillum sp. TaxID=45200 RepID=UPI002D0576E7|nr:DUF4956 domain-containing protein [Methanospirillum sp.]HOJ95564.1 DUF4956 domain-containing protein [Methanospirillum sp.]